MTILTAITDGKEVWLGNNTHASFGTTPIVQPQNQWWIRLGDWIFGNSGASAAFDLISLHRDQLAKPDTKDVLALLLRIRKLLTEYDCYSKDDDASPSFGFSAIVAHRLGMIWSVDTRLAVTSIPKNTLWAHGCGMDFALGADTVLGEMNLDLRTRITKATQAAIKCDTDCPGQVKVFKL